MLEERFSIIRTIRKGPNTGDYEALDTTTNEMVNIRRCFLSSAVEADTSWHASFLAMGASLVNLEHPNLLEVNEVGFDEDGPYISCELVEVKSIFKAYPDGVSNEMFFKAARQVLSALEVIHNKNLVHGAVVVDSLQVTNSENGDDFLIYDLGMHWVKNRLRGEAYSYQDPVFTPPEFLMNSQANAQSDVYMFGHLLYCLWAGAHPLGGMSLAEAMLKHKTHDFPPVHKIRKNVPRKWSKWLDLLTSPDLSERPENATAALACMPTMPGAAAKRQSDPASALAPQHTKHTQSSPHIALQSTGATLIGGQPPLSRVVSAFSMVSAQISSGLKGKIVSLVVLLGLVGFAGCMIFSIR